MLLRMKELCLLLFHLTSSGCVGLSIPAGIHFKETYLEKSFLVLNTETAPNVTYHVAKHGFPDPPDWVRIINNYTSGSAIIYGTPPFTEIGITSLDIVAWDKDNYEVSVNQLNLTVRAADHNLAKYQLEFKVENKNMIEIIGKCENFLNIVKTQIWSSASILVKCEGELDRSDKNPIPGEKEGVYIVIAGKDPFPSNVDGIKNNCRDPASFQVIHNEFQANGYDVDWCALNTAIVSSLNYNIPVNGFSPETDVFLEAATVPSEALSEVHQTLTLDVVFVFIPVVIGIVLVVVLSCVLWCDQERGGFQGTSHHRNLRQQSGILRKVTQQPLKTRPPIYQKPPSVRMGDSSL